MRKEKINFETIKLDYSLIKQDLNTVDELYSKHPAVTIENIKARISFEDADEEIDFSKHLKKAISTKSKEGLNFHTIEKYIDNDLELLDKQAIEKKFSEEDLCKLITSFTYTKPKSFEDAINGNPTCWLLKKIRLSCWHWSYVSANWNFMVECFNLIRRFDIGIPGFGIDIDTTLYHSNRGHARNNDVYLDGELAFIVSFENKHVLTISFNTIEAPVYSSEDSEKVEYYKKTIQIVQIQCKNKKGNRWLFKLPENHVQFFLKKFHEHFIGFDIEFCTSEFFTYIKDNYKREVDVLTKRLQMFPEDETVQYLKQAEEKLKHFTEVEIFRLSSIYDREYPGIQKISGHKKMYSKLIFV